VGSYLLALLLAVFHTAYAQTGSVGIGTTAPDAAAALDIVSTATAEAEAATATAALDTFEAWLRRLKAATGG